ncbi:hypothetical protein K466DRAFT_311763 [Polyporus arcularius HHB13444]|uniref:Uncharacterized protein n=1 Tax=Polyporus arcularius HHB13444 TaxID=1314778 RepID=A0A5C3NXU8_9APHY|nr:hypothetical protein K466DRAFT_311763 [Polyporus arcularius HHB13444]
MPMLASSSRHAPPFPAQTPPPVPVQQGLKRRRVHHESHERAARDTSIVDQAAIDAAVDRCFNDSGNDVVSCYPNSSTTVAQHEWATFVWNSRLPWWAQTNLVNLYLFHADSGEQVLNFTNVVNPTRTSGQKHVQVDDRWWGTRGENWNGQNVSFPFYWLITRNDRPIENTDVPQATFTAVQTTFADSVIASMSSASAASSRSAASASSASAASASLTSAQTSLPTSTRTPGSSGADPSGTGASVQGGSGSGAFPKWAIAVIVVLGFFALLATGILAFYMIRRFRRRRDGTLSHRTSMGSSTPMMANADAGGGPQSPVIGSAVLGAGAGAAAGYGAGAYSHRRSSTGGDGHDGASMTSRTSDAGPFSGADAAIMANAFRQALRKPDFADRPVEEGDSPDEQNTQGHAELISQELAEEGRDIRSVGSSRGVRVETLSDDGNDTATVHDHQYHQY